MITNDKKIKDESSVSRQMQQQVPSADLDGTFKKHTHVSQYDTADRILAEDLNREMIPVNEVVYKNDNIIVSPIATELVEVVPTSNLTEYNKIKVDIDREGHLFYFDWTPNNKRIHLRHPSGTHWHIDDDGNYNFKTVNNYNKIVKGSEKAIINYGQSVLIKDDRKISIKKSDHLAVAKKKHLTVGSDYGIVVGGSEYRNIDGKRVTNIVGEDIIKIARYKTQDVIGSYSVISKDFISFRAPTVIIDAGKFLLRSKSSFKEQVSGSREILAEKLVLSGIDGVTITSMGNFSQVTKGISEETVSGVPSLPAGTDSKIITVNIGGFKVETMMGSITLEGLAPLPVSIKNTLGSVDIGLTGKIDLASPFSDISITETGEVILTGSMGSVSVGLSSTEIDHSAQIKLGSGASSEFAVLGAKLLTWINAHQHGSGTGPTSSPLQPATPTDFGSLKVFIE